MYTYTKSALLKALPFFQINVAHREGWLRLYRVEQLHGGPGFKSQHGGHPTLRVDQASQWPMGDAVAVQQRSQRYLC